MRYATDYIERRMSRSRAYRMHIEQEMVVYAIATGQPVSSGEEVDPIRERIAGVVGVKAVELVAFERGNDAEIVQRVAAYLLLSNHELGERLAAQVMGEGEQWVGGEGFRRSPREAQSRASY